MSQSVSTTADNSENSVERIPTAVELGPYAQFFVQLEDLPRFKIYSPEGILEWLKPNKERRGVNKPQPIQSQYLNRLCYKKPKVWNKGNSSYFDVVTRIHLLIIPGVILFSLGVLDDVLQEGASSAFLFERVNRFITTSITATTAVGYVWSRRSKDKKNFLEEVMSSNESLLNTFTNGDELVLEARKKGLNHLKLQMEKNDGSIKFKPLQDSTKTLTGRFTEEERYELALLRITELWKSVDEEKQTNYCLWMGLSDEQAEEMKREDLEIFYSLKTFIENQTNEDMKAGLNRLMSESETEQYLPTLTDEPEFWLKRTVKVRPADESEEEEKGFLDWIGNLVQENKVNFLLSEGAKGKSTLVNMLVLHLMKEGGGVIPLRLKLRGEFKPGIGLIENIKESYGREGVDRNVRRRLEAVLEDREKHKVLLVLDGLDELKRNDQTLLIDLLSKENSDYPILVVSRPLKEELTRYNRAHLGEMNKNQRVRVMRNLDISADTLKKLERNIPDILLDRPFALLIAAQMLSSDETAETTLHKICKRYDKLFFDRESQKKPAEESLKDEYSFLKPLKETIGKICKFKIEEDKWPEDPKEIDEDAEFASRIDYARSINLIDENNALIDTWLTGFYAIEFGSPDKRTWTSSIENLDTTEDENQLTLRHLLSKSDADMVPSWNQLSSKAPLVMDIASQEWLAMKTESRCELLERLGIPSDKYGKPEFRSEYDLQNLQTCEIIELLGLMHFYCSIADSEQWHNEEGFSDEQWDLIFNVLKERYYSHSIEILRPLREEIYKELNKENPEKGTRDPPRRFPFRSWPSVWKSVGFSLYSEPNNIHLRDSSEFLRTLHSEESASYLSKMKFLRLIPFTGKSRYSKKTLYSKEANPQPLLNQLKRTISHTEDAESMIFIISMIEILSKRVLFNLSLESLMEFIPKDFDFKDKNSVAIVGLFQRMSGYRMLNKFTDILDTDNDFSATPPEVIQWAENLPSKDFTVEQIRDESGRTTFSNETFRYKLAAAPMKPVFINPEQLTQIGESRVRENQIFASNPSKYKIELDEEIISAMWPPFLRISDLSESKKEAIRELVPKHQPQEGCLVITEAGISSFVGKPDRLKTFLPVQYVRLNEGRVIQVQPAANALPTAVIKSRLGLGPISLIRGPHLFKMRRSTHVTPSRADRVIPIPPEGCSLPNRHLLIPEFIGGVAPPENNQTICEIHKKIHEKANAKFQPDTSFEEMRENIQGLGEVIFYLEASDIPMSGGRPYRRIMMPGSEWWDKQQDFSDFTYEVLEQSDKSPIEKAFLNIFSMFNDSGYDNEILSKIHLNRWYSAKFHLESDSSGYRRITPIPDSIRLQCQSCATEPIEISKDTIEFLCDKCKSSSVVKRWKSWQEYPKLWKELLRLLPNEDFETPEIDLTQEEIESRFNELKEEEKKHPKSGLKWTNYSQWLEEGEMLRKRIDLLLWTYRELMEIPR